MGTRLMAIVAEGERGRLYISPTAEHEPSPEGTTDVEAGTEGSNACHDVDRLPM